MTLRRVVIEGLSLGVFAALLYGWGVLVTTIAQGQLLRFVLFLIGVVVLTWLSMTHYIKMLRRRLP